LQTLFHKTLIIPQNLSRSQMLPLSKICLSLQRHAGATSAVPSYALHISCPPMDT